MKKLMKKTTIDDLAVMVANGFEAAHKDTHGIKGDIQGIKQDVKELRQDIQELHTGQEQIILRLNNVAYRFEMVELQKRVEVLEKHAGIQR